MKMRSMHFHTPAQYASKPFRPTARRFQVVTTVLSDLGRRALADVTPSNAAAPTDTTGLFAETTPSGAVVDPDTNGVELGMRFSPPSPVS